VLGPAAREERRGEPERGDKNERETASSPQPRPSFFLPMRIIASRG